MISTKIAGNSSTFTLKHISISGEEQLYVASGIHFKPGRDIYPHELRLVQFTSPTGVAQLSGGTVFVMNESGRTVARYDLGASPVPLDEAEDKAA
jgi:hypothetical protein